MKKLKINSEPIPKSMHYVNLRSELSKEEWNFIKKLVYKRANYRCEICGQIGPKWPVEAHEIWKYDEKNGIMKLDKIMALCPDCHLSHHLGFAQIKGKYEQAINHLKEINNFTEKELEIYLDKLWKDWERRNKINWKLDIKNILIFLKKAKKDNKII